MHLAVADILLHLGSTKTFQNYNSSDQISFAYVKFITTHKLYVTFSMFGLKGLLYTPSSCEQSSCFRSLAKVYE